MSSEVDAKAWVAARLKEGRVGLTFVWDARGEMQYCGPSMRTDQILELLLDALDYFKRNQKCGETLQ